MIFVSQMANKKSLLESKSIAVEPSAVFVVFKKIFVSVLCAGIFVSVTPLFNITRVKGQSRTINSFVYSTFYTQSVFIHFKLVVSVVSL